MQERPPIWFFALLGVQLLIVAAYVVFATMLTIVFGGQSLVEAAAFLTALLLIAFGLSFLARWLWRPDRRALATAIACAPIAAPLVIFYLIGVASAP